METAQQFELQHLLDITIQNSFICCRADSCDGPVPAQPASAGPLLSDEVETVDGPGHSQVPSGGHVQQQGDPSAAVPTVNQTTGPGQPPATPADVQIKTSRLLPGPVQPTVVSLVDGQRGASTSAVLQRHAQHSAVGQVHHSLHAPALGPGQRQLAAALTDDHTEGQLSASVPAQPAQEQGQPAAASADSQGKGQVVGMLPVQEPAAVSSHQLGNGALVSNTAKVEAAHSAQPAGTVQGSDASKAGGSVATAMAAIAGSNLHQGTAISAAGASAQSAALASGHSSAPQAAQAAAAISSALEAALHNASGHDAEPHANPAASTAALPAGAQAQGEATDEGDTAAAAAHAQDAGALAAAAAASAANAVGGVAPQVADGQGTALHVAAEDAAQAVELAPIADVGAGIDPAAPAPVPSHAMQAEDEAADPASPPLPPPPPMPTVNTLQASAAQAHVGAPNADPAASPRASKSPVMEAYYLAADCTAAAGTVPTAADALMAHTPASAAPGEVADPVAAVPAQQNLLPPIAQRAPASKGWRPKVGQALTVTVVLPTLVALHVPVGCWAASVIGAAVCKKALSAW